MSASNKTSKPVVSISPPFIQIDDNEVAFETGTARIWSLLFCLKMIIKDIYMAYLERFIRTQDKEKYTIEKYSYQK